MTGISGLIREAPKDPLSFTVRTQRMAVNQEADPHLTPKILAL